MQHSGELQLLIDRDRKARCIGKPGSINVQVPTLQMIGYNHQAIMQWPFALPSAQRAFSIQGEINANYLTWDLANKGLI